MPKNPRTFLPAALALAAGLAVSHRSTGLGSRPGRDL